MIIPTTLQEHFDFMVDNEPLPQFKVRDGDNTHYFYTLDELKSFARKLQKQNRNLVFTDWDERRVECWEVRD